MSACTETKQREANGRFATGNRGGPGNPFNRQIGVLRRRMMAAVTPEEIEDTIRILMYEARSGNIAACKLVLELAVGKPGKSGVWRVEGDGNEYDDDAPLPTVETVADQTAPPTVTVETVPGVKSAAPSPSVITVAGQEPAPLQTLETVAESADKFRLPSVDPSSARYLRGMDRYIMTINDGPPSRNGEIRIDPPLGHPYARQTRDISARGS